MKISLFFIFVNFCLYFTNALAADWQKISEEDGVATFQGKSSPESSLISLRGESVINASIDEIISIMENNSTAHLWMPMVAERKLLRQVAKNDRIELTRIAMPWPLTDRYFITRAIAERISIDKMRVSIRSVESPEEKWLDPEKILGFMHYSEFTLTQVIGGKDTYMVLEVNSDPKGSIPSILVNFTQRSWPQKFYRGLNQMLQRAGLLAD